MELMVSDILLTSDMEVVIHEIHNLAYFYHWGYEECWKMPKRERKIFNERIIEQLKAEQKAAKGEGTGGKSYLENTSRF